MTKLIATLLFASVYVSAQEAAPAAVGDRWEYCIAQSSGGTTANGNLVGSVTVYYATEQGRREDYINLTQPMPQGMSERNLNFAMQLAADKAVGKAMAQLGMDRWELVGVNHEKVEGSYFPIRTLYFKRRVR